MADASQAIGRGLDFRYGVREVLMRNLGECQGAEPSRHGVGSAGEEEIVERRPLSTLQTPWVSTDNWRGRLRGGSASSLWILDGI